MTFKEFLEKYAGKRYEFVDGRLLPHGPEKVTDSGEVIVLLTKPVPNYSAKWRRCAAGLLAAGFSDFCRAGAMRNRA